ncbi:MAG: SAM-dependent chlorinase/fluorinase [Bacteroidetes bacterium]|nr:SAM-dependent chlorinase/fluorinase [Bacteroidota bacterium]
MAGIPVITLSTDIGTKDYLAGAIKGQLIAVIPQIIIADISHELSGQNYFHAAYICKHAFRHFPQESIHIVIVNLFEKLPHYLLLAKFNDQYIICPDNGMLTMITGKQPEEMVAIEVKPAGNFGLLACTSAIANAIQKLSDGISFEQIGPSIHEIVEKYPLRATYGSDWLDCQVIFIDHFENVVINLTKEEFEEHRKGRKFKIELKNNEVIETISENYASVQPGDSLAWFNSADYLEIAVNKGNVAGLFGLETYLGKGSHSQVKMSYHTIRIFFE